LRFDIARSAVHHCRLALGEVLSSDQTISHPGRGCVVGRGKKSVHAAEVMRGLRPPRDRCPPGAASCNCRLPAVRRTWGVWINRDSANV